MRLFIQDTFRRAAAVAHEGPAEIFRATDEATALTVLHDRTAGKLCYAAGPDRLVVPAANLPAFRRALKALGFVAPQGRIG